MTETKAISLWVCSGQIHATQPDWCVGGDQHNRAVCYPVWTNEYRAKAERQREVGDPR